jgi:predicted RNA binding protein YcfA (HicA-like mRNA interferase family)
MPRKIRDLVKDLLEIGFHDRGGKGSHRNFVHPNIRKLVTLSGKDRDDAKPYQEKAVLLAIEEVLSDD